MALTTGMDTSKRKTGLHGDRAALISQNLLK